MAHFAECEWCGVSWDTDYMTHDCAITDEVIRRLLLKCVMVINPGQVLAVRMPLEISEEQMGRLERTAEFIHDHVGVKVLFIGGEEFAVMNPEPEKPERLGPGEMMEAHWRVEEDDPAHMMDAIRRDLEGYPEL